jgi:short-subunit dehydrogenase
VIPRSPAERISGPFSALNLADLTSSQGVTERRRIHVDLFVNNAGFSRGGEFL